MNISFLPTLGDTKTLVLLALDDGTIFGAENTLEDINIGKLKQGLANQEFKGKKGEIAAFANPIFAETLEWLLVLGLGKAEAITPLSQQEAGGTLYTRLAALPLTKVAVSVAVPPALTLSEEELVANLAYGAKLRAYRFDKYLTKEKEDGKKPKINHLTFVSGAYSGAEKLYANKEKIAEGVYVTRTLQNEPGNIIYPKTLADAAIESAKNHGLKTKLLDAKDMKKLGMHALLGVAQGSVNEPYLVVMEYHGADDKKAAPIAFVGKGVTFDTGGISIKPSAGMEDMKWDMGGAGVVIGLMQALAARKEKINAIGVIGLVENMPSGNAQRPGDIVTSMSGQTIEVLNTDAEGRLVLADALWYTQENYKPHTIIDLATLTGAIIVALGETTAGLFSNDDALAEKLSKAGKTVGEPVWRLPLGAEYDKDIDSEYADMKNIGSGRGAGSITAAQFLGRFIQPGVKWAHLDIAGVTWAKKPTALHPKGATGFGVRLLQQFVKDVEG